ncbi:HPr(Ser) kinase/phosphatase, partial [[Ruminococcus] gnavus]|nr:HPr(Ser) kinase/phosphatase [Mediterraneibacter gnavus]
GFFDHFDSERVQIIVYVEYAYIQTLSEERKSEIYEKLLNNQIPCIIFSKNLLPEENLLQKAEEKQIPIFAT